MTGRSIALSALALFAVLVIGWLALIHRIDPVAAPPIAALGSAVSGGGDLRPGHAALTAMLSTGLRMKPPGFQIGCATCVCPAALVQRTAMR